jgi:hypothetical protein
MIISASRRTDIPAFYAPWFMNRLRAGWCLVPNPFRPTQVSEVSLTPEDVEVISFWTRNPSPLLPYLREIEERGYRFYFLYTLMTNPRVMDPGCPPLKSAIKTFQTLAEQIGPDKVIWRYDPIAITTVTDPDYHKRAFRRIAGELRGFTTRCIISNVHVYLKAEKRFREKGICVQTLKEEPFGNLMRSLAGEAKEQGMEIQSCAQTVGLERYGVRHGKCVDDEYIKKVFGIEVSPKKDTTQRKACGCVKSKDIGMYDTCLYGCLYCYATGDFKKAQENYRRHDPLSPTLVPL